VAPRKIRHTAGGPLRVLGYVRVSTEEQGRSGAGLAAQRAAIRRACEERGYELADLVEDKGFSAKSLERPGITRVLEQLEAGGAGGLVVAKLDRLSRSLLDFAGLMERARRQGWALVALDLGVDTSTPAGEMMANVLATFAQFERRMIGQRTKDALAQKRAAGVRLGRPRSLSDEVVQRIIEQRAGGLTLQSIADGLNDEGVPTAQGGALWRPSSVRVVLTSVEQFSTRDLKTR
jgi:DNA invertase Pin-like site-specific DNA recombinase